METYLFKGKKETRIKAVSYLDACGLFVKQLEEKNHVEIDKSEGHVFIDEFTKKIEIYKTDALEYNHACALYVKSLVDRKLLYRASEE